jgi:membrane-associated phospholipid phosphatase
MKKFTIIFLLIIFRSNHADPIEDIGNVLVYTLPASTVILTICNHDIKGLKQYSISSLIDEGITLGLKYSVNELRPNHYDYHSFPSGHATITFAAAEFIRKRYGWQYGVPAYAIAIFTSYSRVESKWHYSHDVIAGGMIGITCSFIITTKSIKQLN